MREDGNDGWWEKGRVWRKDNQKGQAGENREHAFKGHIELQLTGDLVLFPPLSSGRWDGKDKRIGSHNIKRIEFLTNPSFKRLLFNLSYFNSCTSWGKPPLPFLFLFCIMQYWKPILYFRFMHLSPAIILTSRRAQSNSSEFHNGGRHFNSPRMTRCSSFPNKDLLPIRDRLLGWYGLSYFFLNNTQLSKLGINTATLSSFWYNPPNWPRRENFQSLLKFPSQLIKRCRL